MTDKIAFKIYIKDDGSEPVECKSCDHGLRHKVGNCVICGCGPAPGLAWSRKPETPEELALALTTVGVYGRKAGSIINKVYPLVPDAGYEPANRNRR